MLRQFGSSGGVYPQGNIVEAQQPDGQPGEQPSGWNQRNCECKAQPRWQPALADVPSTLEVIQVAASQRKNAALDAGERRRGCDF